MLNLRELSAEIDCLLNRLLHYVAQELFFVVTICDLKIVFQEPGILIHQMAYIRNGVVNRKIYESITATRYYSIARLTNIWHHSHHSHIRTQISSQNIIKRKRWFYWCVEFVRSSSVRYERKCLTKSSPINNVKPPINHASLRMFWIVRLRDSNVVSWLTEAAS